MDTHSVWTMVRQTLNGYSLSVGHSQADGLLNIKLMMLMGQADSG